MAFLGLKCLPGQAFSLQERFSFDGPLHTLLSPEKENDGTEMII